MRELEVVLSILSDLKSVLISTTNLLLFVRCIDYRKVLQRAQYAGRLSQNHFLQRACSGGFGKPWRPEEVRGWDRIPL